MSDRTISRCAGIFGLATIAVFLVEFPFYLVRGQFPTMAEPARLADYAARNSANIMTCLLLDLVILGCFMVFTAGLRHVIRQADPKEEWLGTLFFGVGLVYVTVTFVADSLQAATVIDALSRPADPTVIRAMMESMYLMYGSVALFLMGVLMGVAGYAGVASRALPGWSGWTANACAAACLGFVPTVYAGEPDPTGFYNPSGYGPLAIAAGLPLTIWMAVTSILLIRKRSSLPSITGESSAN